MDKVEITTLPSGLRVVTDRVDTVETVAVGVWVGVGTRFEDLKDNGVAHMVEHMLFKGTPTRKANDIAEQIENVGGHMNAYTSRELTSYYIHLLKDDLPLAVDVLSDMVQRSTMPDDEVERERGVILQEIGMCNDTPDDVIFDHYYETAYPGQALGAPILGTNQIIESMQRDTLMGYTQQFYSPSRMVVCAAGNVEHEAFVALVEKMFDSLPKDQDFTRKDADYQGGEFRLSKDLEQSHIILGFKGVPRTDDDYFTAQTLAVLMGGGMSSRLFQEIREKRGLVYSVYSYHTAYTDDGQFGIYAGTGPEKLPELIPVVCDEIGKLAGSVSDSELERAKAQLLTSTLMARESMVTRVDMKAKALLLNGRILPIEDVLKNIDAVDTAALDRVAKRIFSSTPTLAGIGPLGALEDYSKIQDRLAA